MKLFALKFKLKYYLLLFLLLFVGLKVCTYYPNAVEHYYTNGFYRMLSTIMQAITAYIPFSIGDVLYVIVGACIVYNYVVVLREKANWKGKLGNFASLSIKIFVCFALLFNICWGFNNYRIPLNQQLHIEGTYTQAELIDLTKKLITTTNAQLVSLTNDSLQAVTVAKTNEVIFSEIHDGLNKVGQRTQLFTYFPHRVKSSLFSLPLTYMGFAGYLNPFTLEAQVNTLIPKTTMIVTASHEVIHQLGYAHESDANFLGYLAASEQNQEVYRYGANIYALRYCLNAIDYNENEPMLLDDLLQSIYPGVQTNIMENTVFWQSYKTYTDSFFKVFYGAFLKANNQKDGIRSYNRFVDLLVNYNKKTTLYP